MNLPITLLTQLSEALLRPPPRSHFAAARWKSILATGWAYWSDVEDHLVDLDRRLRCVELRALADRAGYQMRPVRARPRFASSQWMAMDAMLPHDLTALCIFLEECGFLTDASPMVGDLIGGLAGRSTMTLSEADIYTFTKLRHARKIHLRAEEEVGGTLNHSQWRTGEGYRCERMTSSDRVTALTIRGPKWRERPMIRIDCEVCGERYTKGDPESTHDHRKQHTRVVRLLTPLPDPRLRDRLAHVENAERVDLAAPLWMQREVYERAFRFKRELGYDSIQWHDPGNRARLDPLWVGYLFASPDGLIDGACAFRFQEGEWALHWVWIRPDMRRCGVLASRWENLVANHGDFWIEHPLSSAMESFVAKHATPGQHSKIADRMRLPNAMEQDQAPTILPMVPQ